MDEIVMGKVPENYIRIRTGIIDGRSISYTDQTEFLIQTRKKNSHKGYVTKYNIKGSHLNACFYYMGINVSHEYRKRIYVPSFNKPILAVSE